MVKIGFYLILPITLVVSQAWGDFMICGKGNVYEGDSEAEVIMRCGPPCIDFAPIP